ncbi:MAG: aminotransferase, partial [Candidatus Heimdallarchaeota archaeon]
AHPYILKLLKVLDDEELLKQMEVMEGQESRRPGAVRASIGIYNTQEEIEHFLDVVEQIAKSH